MGKKNKIILIIQARLGSKRLPKKVLKKISRKSILDIIIDRVKKIEPIDEFWIATTKNKLDNKIESLFENKINIFRGEEEDVLKRYYDLSLMTKANIIIRITSDCPFVDPKLITEGIKLFKKLKVDYLSNVLLRTFPDGLDFEIFNFKALELSHKECKDISLREHVTPYMRLNKRNNFNKSSFKIYNVKNNIDFSHLRLTLDDNQDYKFIKKIITNNGFQTSWLEAVSFLLKNPAFLEKKFISKRVGALNKTKKIQRNKKYIFRKSNNYFSRVENTIPLGSQTFSKSYMQYSKGAAPLFANKGEGAYLYDLDNNKYIDYVMGLLPLVLGYRDEQVDFGIKDQINKGITFSLASSIEYKLASKLVEIIPCAEMVRFGKNGSDATSAAIRLARHYTKRDNVLISGYHGWHDWYIGSTTRDKGVPLSIKKLTTKVNFNDIEKIENELRKNKYAAYILEPYVNDNKDKDLIKKVRALTKETGTILIFDEIISGFRVNLGGMQKEIKVTPDLATFGKAIANGMPLSVVAGKKKLMQGMKEIFFSTTFGGETLSIAAALATIKKIQEKNVCNSIKYYGDKLIIKLNEIIENYHLGENMMFTGPNWWPSFKILESSLNPVLFKSLLRQELNASGLLINSTLNISYAHCNEKVFIETLNQYNKAVKSFSNILKSKNPKSKLKGSLIQPTFEVRS